MKIVIVVEEIYVLVMWVMCYYFNVYLDKIYKKCKKKCIFVYIFEII